jgi:hypothetical protein
MSSINLNQINGYIAKSIFSNYIDEWNKQKLSYNQMKERFIQII